MINLLNSTISITQLQIMFGKIDLKQKTEEKLL